MPRLGSNSGRCGVLVAMSLSVLSGPACDRKDTTTKRHSATTKAVETTGKVMANVVSLIGGYQLACKKGDANEARKYLQELASLDPAPEQRHAMMPGVFARSSFIAYGLLFSLDKQLGDEDRATVDMIKARYWDLVEMEQSGILDKKRILAVKSLTEDQLLAAVRNSDRSMLFKAVSTTRSITGD